MGDFLPVCQAALGEKWIPPEFVLFLKPQQGLSNDDVHATVNLRIQFSADYPFSQPCINLENPKGVSTKDIEKLKEELGHISSRSVGEEVIFNLAHHIQSFLAERNKKPRFQSFHEEMLAAQRNEIEKCALEERSRQSKQDEQQLLEFCEEIQKKQPALLNELRKMSNLSISNFGLFDDNDTNVQCQESEDHGIDFRGSSDALCQHETIKILEFSNKDSGRYVCGPCLGRCSANRHVFAAVDTRLNEYAAITMWKVKSVVNLIKPLFLVQQ